MMGMGVAVGLGIVLAGLIEYLDKRKSEWTCGGTEPGGAAGIPIPPGQAAWGSALEGRRDFGDCVVFGPLLRRRCLEGVAVGDTGHGCERPFELVRIRASSCRSTIRKR
jgi:hypothetical protein